MSRRPPVAVLGAGAVGRGLARALAGAGWPVRRVWSRRPGPARALARALGGGARARAALPRALEGCPAVLLAVPAGALTALARTVAGAPLAGGAGRVFLHTSGAVGSAVLEPLRRTGAACGRLHPLYPFTARPAALAGVAFGVSGDARAVALSRRMVRALGGRTVEVADDASPAYHLAAVLASNLLVALAAEAAALGGAELGGRRQALEALLPLMQATLANLEAEGLPGALTGPLARGEAAAVRSHLDHLQATGRRDLSGIYRLLSRAGLDLALESGRLDPDAARSLRRALGRQGNARGKP